MGGVIDDDISTPTHPPLPSRRHAPRAVSWTTKCADRKTNTSIVLYARQLEEGGAAFQANILPFSSHSGFRLC